MPYQYGHLTEELLKLLPDEPMVIADSFGDSVVAKRLRTMINAYGEIASHAYHEACLIKYEESTIQEPK